MAHPKSILEQILDELRESRKEQHDVNERVHVELREQRKLIHRILREEDELESDLSPEALSMTYDTSATPFSSANPIGGTTMGQPSNIQVGQTGFGKVTEWSGANGTGSAVPPPGPLGIIYASDNVAVATVDAGGNPTGVSAGTANVTALDQDNNLTDTSVVTVSAVTPPPPPAVSMTYDTSATAFPAARR